MSDTRQAELDEFQARVRTFVEANTPAIKVRRGHRAPDAGDIPALRAWTAALYAEGFYGADWPPEWGGTLGADPLRQVVVVTELARANAATPIGAGYLASRAIIAYGTDTQRRRYLPRIRSGEDLWCQLFSESGAGSDLAALQTRATGHGSGYIVDGQKVWTTNGQHADLGFLLARSAPNASKHAGITAFALDMRARGVSVRPLREITGTADFNEVFLDGVEVSEDDVIGRPGDGWKVTTEALAHERLANTGLPIRLQLLFDDVVDLARAVGANCRPVSRQALATRAIDVWRSRLANDASLGRVERGEETTIDGPLSKIISSEANVALTDLALDLAGPAALLVEGDSRAIDDGRWPDEFLYARALPIAGGTNQIMRNLLAERGLGLPRERAGGVTRPLWRRAPPCAR